MPHLSTIERFPIDVLFDFVVVLNGVFMLCYILYYSSYGEARILIKRSERVSTTKKASDTQILLILCMH
jgi:hypothetical protein